MQVKTVRWLRNSDPKSVDCMYVLKMPIKRCDLPQSPSSNQDSDELGPSGSTAASIENVEELEKSQETCDLAALQLQTPS